MPLTSTSLKNRSSISWMLPVLALGFALIVTIWAALWMQISSERRAMIQSLIQETDNLALVFEQDIERTAGEIDRIIRYLRSAYERQGHRADWPALVMEEFTANHRTVQIAIMDAKGMMITSSKMLHPAKPVDLSDREHFRVHADAKSYLDRLFISKPVMGRASRKWSVQFTRPYRDAEGGFAGVIVVSLDPEFLTLNFAGLNLGTDGGLAIVGEDNVVRAGAGTYYELFDQTFPATKLTPPPLHAHPAAVSRLEEDATVPRATAARKLKDFPLTAIVTRSDEPGFESWNSNVKKYTLGAGLLTLAIIFAMLRSHFRRCRYEKQLTKLVRYDSLTDLLNRREFAACLSELIRTTEHKQPFYVHVLDLDGFKRVNDTYGHPVGDELLVAVGKRLRSSVRMVDTVARLGGDEFAVIQRNAASLDEATDFSETLCSALSAPYSISGRRIEIGVSIGLVSSEHPFADEDELMISADLALYAAKNSGGRTYRFYSERMNDEARERRQIEEGLRDAIAEGQLEVHYQPIFSIDGLKMNSVEALIRWRHPVKGLIPPGAFIPVAEQSGLIVQIGSWVMERACTEIAARSSTLQVAVNVSAVEFSDGDVSSSVRRAIEVSGIDPKRLKVEITESLLMNKDRSTLDQLDRIRELGVRISMDDFGTGYSSLSYLQSYPIDYIKIDRSFVSGLGQVPNSTAIVEAIARLARAMGMTTVAEGVETEMQLEMLRNIGCAEAQGFLLSRPKRIEEILPVAQGKVPSAQHHVHEMEAALHDEEPLPQHTESHGEQPSATAGLAA